MPVNSSVPLRPRVSRSKPARRLSAQLSSPRFRIGPGVRPRPPSPALAPRISGPRAKISSWHTYRARTSRRALKRNCIQPPRRISARVTLPRVPATANRSGIVIPVHGGGVCFGILWRLSLAILGATWSTCRRLALNADFWYFSFFREYY